MSEIDTGDLNTLIQGKLEADTEFQSSLESMEEADRESAIQAKREELITTTLTELQKAVKEKEELANNYKVRAEKAEKGKSKPQETKEDTGFSMDDALAIMRAEVHDDDIEEVKRLSKLLDKNIRDTLKDPVTIGILKRNEEYRATAQAQNTGKGKASTHTLTDEQLIKNASEGKLPEKGSKEAEDLFWAKRGGRRE